MRFGVWLLMVLLSVAPGARSAAAQGTGTIGGAVHDSSGGALPGASVEVVNEETAVVVRNTAAGEGGNFTITALPQGRYTLRVGLTGFQTLERRGIQLRSAEILNAGNLVLNVGQFSEATTVTADLAIVQTTTANRTAVLEAEQLDALVARGRDPISLLNLLPGTVPNFGSTILGGTVGTGVPTIQGQPGNATAMTVDGMPSNDGDLTGNNNSPMSMDSVEEVRVILNGFAAEFGRGSGAQINLVSKSGSQRFSGSLAGYIRNEALNSNPVQNQRQGLPKPYYRYYTGTGTIGGPVVVPGKGRLSRTFFFYSREMWDTKLPVNPRSTIMPTERERRGDFSQTTLANGNRFFIADPLRVQAGQACSSTTGGPGCFPDNIIPTDRQSALGSTMLNLLPLPNYSDPSVSAGFYNYRDQDIGHRTAALDQITVDHNVTDADRLKVTFRRWAPNREAYTGVFGVNSNFNQFRGQYAQSEKSIQIGHTRTIGSSLVNEATFSFRRTPEGGPVDTNPDPIAMLQRGPQGLGGLGRLYSDDPALNPYDLYPQISFAGVGGQLNNNPTAPNVAWDARFPIDAGDDRYNFTNNLTWIKGNHVAKFGFFYEWNRNSEGDSANCFSGCLDFSSTGTTAAQNPFNTNHPFANALMGNYTTYQESNTRPVRGGQAYFAEWFAQDSWRVRTNVTLELGMRFSWGKPWHLIPGYSGSSFAAPALVPGTGGAGNPLLFQPACAPPATTCSGNARLARNPLTGQLLPNSFIGQLVPDSGNFYNGMVGENDPLGYGGQFQESPGLKYQPRLGIAWDPFGDQKMSIRANYGIATQIHESSGAFAGNIPLAPPVRLQPTLFYGNLAQLGNIAQQQIFAAQNVTGFGSDRTPARTTHNFAIEVQRNIGFETVVGIGYVGNRQRQLTTTRNVNQVAPGERFDPANADPTSATGAVLQDNFLRELPQFGNVNVSNNEGYANYDSMQLTANRRFSNGFSFGGAYTLARTMDLQGGLNVYEDVYGDNESRLYDYANTDRRHIGALNFTYDVPDASGVWSNVVTRGVLDNWQLAAVWFIQSGAPAGITYTTTDAGGTDTVGGGSGAGNGADQTRITILPGCEPMLSGGERTEERWFDTSCFARTPRGSVGNAPRQVIRQPGRQNVDLTLSKNFPLGGNNSRRLQFRAEIYNVFALTTQNADTSAQFDAAGNQIDPNFGRLELPEGEARVVQLSLRFQF